MKNILIALAFLFAVPAFAGERQIINPDVDGDLKLRVNIGGTVTDAITVTGTTGTVTNGPNVSGATLNLTAAGNTPVLKFEGGVGQDVSIDVVGGSLRWYVDGGTVVGTINQSGTWTIGNTGNTTTHAISGNFSFGTDTARLAFMRSGTSAVVAPGATSATQVVHPNGFFGTVQVQCYNASNGNVTTFKTSKIGYLGTGTAVSNVLGTDLSLGGGCAFTVNAVSTGFTLTNNSACAAANNMQCHWTSWANGAD